MSLEWLHVKGRTIKAMVNPTSIRLTDRTKAQLNYIIDMLEFGGRGQSRAIAYAIDVCYQHAIKKRKQGRKSDI